MSNPMDRHDRPRRRRHTSTHFVPETDPGHPEVYQIRIKGHLGQQWADWFCGLTITLEDDGDTVLTGPVVDQAALHGLLKKVRDLGMPLLSVNNVTKIATTHSSRRHYMESQRKNARFAGILLLMGWSGVFIFPFISVLDGANFPMNIDGSGNALVWGALIQMFMVFSCSGIAVFLYPRLKKENPALALWAVVLRGVESAIGLAAAPTLLLLAHMGPQLAQAGPESLAALKSLGLLLRSAYNLLGEAPTSFAFALGALIYNVLLFRARLVPRWISAWGFIGASVSIVSSVLVVLGVSSSTIGFVIDLSAGVQELALAFYLIIKGFREPVGVPERA
jgi:hypothetical protein